MIAIVKYNAGNIQSVRNAVARLGFKSMVTDDASTILQADKVIFPGVGEASSAMDYLKKSGLDEVIRSVRQPFLGICLGLQLMCDRTDEGQTACLGIFNTNVKIFAAREKVPHMGWNSFEFVSGDLFKGIKASDDFYYVHSYYAELNANTLAVCNYINPFSAALNKDNFYATQFHPEKSAGIGEKLLKNFLEL